MHMEVYTTQTWAGGRALRVLIEGCQQLGPTGVPASALDLGELGHELATVDLAGNGLTLCVYY